MDALGAHGAADAAASTPLATYRLQLGPGFGFADAAAIAGYLARLGISHVYLSPFLQAAEGSTHGYDIIDHARVSEELGGAAGYAALSRTLAEHGLGQVLDVVPNHMSIASHRNRWWWDVLENGPASRYASYFDVDWSPPEARLSSVVLLPILGDHYGRVLEAGQIRVVRAGGRFEVRVYDRVLPVAPQSLAEPLAEAAVRVQSDELAFWADCLGQLSTEPERRERDRRVIGAQLARLLEAQPHLAEAVDFTLEACSADPERLDALLERQSYRLAFWRVARHDLDYRRFFDINTLAGLSIQRPEVFDAVHELPLSWIAQGTAHGLRIDHPDGLRDPSGYFARLRAEAPKAWIVAEKILEPDEALPPWPIDGTTGYESLRILDGVFVDGGAEAELDAIHEQLVGEPPPSFSRLARSEKRRMLSEMLASDLSRATAVLVQLCESTRRYRDYTRHELRRVIEELVVELPVYRTYVEPGSAPSERDSIYLREALAAAAAARPELDAELFGLLDAIFHDPGRGALGDELVARIQQLSAPAMAKGVEDTALYNHHRLVCLNEVGGDPRRFGVAVAELHRHFERQQARWPRSMVTTSTHDTKRSEDARLRLAVVTHDPPAWGRLVTDMSERLESAVDAPTRYLFLQTAVAAWPIDAERLGDYMQKAVREAKRRTRWTRPDEAYEARVAAMVTRALGDRVFSERVASFVEALDARARVASLSQLLLKLTVPGVPDIYQGTELWARWLTDPDNRRPVDFSARARLLDEVAALEPEAVMSRMAEGAPKLWLLHRALGVRARRRAAFRGSYQPIAVEGPEDSAVCFARGGEVVVAVPTRFFGEEAALELPAGRWRDALSGQLHIGRVSVGALWRRFPVALLEKEA